MKKKTFLQRAAQRSLVALCCFWGWNASPAAQAAVTIYTPPPSLSGMPVGFASDFQLKADGQSVAVYDADPTDIYQSKSTAISGWNPGVFASFEFSGDVTISVTVPGVSSITSVNVLPTRLGITPTINGNTLTFTLSQPANFGVDVNGNIGRPLWIFANPAETDKPSATDPNVKFFAKGQTYNAGAIDFNLYNIIYIEGGAVVNGNISGAGKGLNPKILGRGILCGSSETNRLKVGDDTGVTISGPVIVGAQANSWTCILTAVDNATIDNVKVIGVQRDAFNPISCQSTVFKNSFFYSFDDAMAIKGWKYTTEITDGLTVQDSVFWNHGAVIGFETLTDAIKNVTFQNLDIIRPRTNIPNNEQNTEPYGQRVAPMKVDVSDHATVSNIRWDNIRIYNPVGVDLFAARLQKSYATSTQDADNRGQIDGIKLNNITVTQAPADWPGRTVLKGCDATHQVKNVDFHLISLNGVMAKNASDIHLMRYNWADSPTITGLPLRTNGPNYVMNPGFEDATELAVNVPVDAPNWQEANDGGESLSASYLARSADTVLDHYSSSAFKARTFQYLNGLTNGSYSLKAKAKRTGGTSVMYVEGYGGSYREVSVPQSSAFENISIAGISITNGTLKIGFFSDMPANGDAKFNDVELTRDVTFDLTGVTAGATYALPVTRYLGVTVSGVPLVNLRVDYFANNVVVGQNQNSPNYYVGWKPTTSGTYGLLANLVNIYSDEVLAVTPPKTVTISSGGAG